MLAGIALLLIGLALVIVGRERADGTSLISGRPWVFALYPATCLAFLAFGLALIIFAL
jgi:hypothetical protein